MDVVATVERFLASQNDTLLAEILRDKNQFMPLLANVKAAYEALGIGDFSTEVWDEIKANGTHSTEKRYHDELENEIAAAGVKHKVLKRVVLEGTDDAISDLRKHYQKAKNFVPVNYGSRNEKLTFSDIGFDGESFVISEVEKEAISEKYCRVYVHPGDEADLFEAVKVVLEARNAFKIVADRLGIGYGITRSFSAFDRYFIWKDGQLIIEPAVVVGATTIAKRMEASGHGCTW